MTYWTFTGVLAGMWPCGIVVLLTELFSAESKSQVFASLHELLRDWDGIQDSLSEQQYYHSNVKYAIFNTHLYIEYVCYDDACHLRRYACNPVRSGLTDTTKFLSSLPMVVDKMHMQGHTDSWCQANCNPKAFNDLDIVGFHIAHFTLDC